MQRIKLIHQRTYRFGSMLVIVFFEREIAEINKTLNLNYYDIIILQPSGEAQMK